MGFITLAYPTDSRLQTYRERTGIHQYVLLTRVSNTFMAGIYNVGM